MGDLLQNKICIITGAGTGIGKSMAICFASEGAEVYAVERSPGGVAAWARELPVGERIHACTADVTDTAQIKAVVLKVRKEWGRIDVLVNNAGVEFNERISMITDEHLETMFRVNVVGTIRMLQLCSRVMMRQESGGSIINISSGVGLHGNPGQLGYAATKGAVVALTKSAAKELGPSQIRVNSIAPGLTNTRMIEGTDAGYLNERIGRIPMGRIAEPEDIARAALFFASDLSAYVSGQILEVNGCAIV